MSSCTTYRQQPLSAAHMAEQFLERRLDNPDLLTFVQANSASEQAQQQIQIWHLNQLTLAALYYHPDLTVARSQCTVALAGQITAKERLNPTLGFTPGFNSSSPSDITPWIFGLNFDIPIETGGKRGYRIAQAQALAQAANLQLAITAWAVRSRLHFAYLSLAITKQQQLLAQQLIETVEKQLADTKQSIILGNNAPYELTQLQSTHAQAVQRNIIVHGQLEVALVQLADAIGIPSTQLSLDQLDLSLPETPSLTLSTVQKKALIGRPDMIAALMTYQASEATLQLEIAQQYPDVHLSPGYSYDQGENKWELGLSISLPIFNNNDGPIAEATARRNEQAAHVLSLQARIAGELATAFTTYQNAQHMFITAQDFATAIAKQQTNITQQIEHGVLPKTALHEGIINNIQAQQQVLESQGMVQRALILVEDAMQSPAFGQLPPWQLTPTIITEQPFEINYDNK